MLVANSNNAVGKRSDFKRLAKEVEFKKAELVLVNITVS
jgi:hypothetical protein